MASPSFLFYCGKEQREIELLLEQDNILYPVGCNLYGKGNRILL